MTKPPDKINLYALHLARVGKEPSNALEQRMYGDPAEFVEFASERQRKLKEKRRAKPAKYRMKERE